MQTTGGTEKHVPQAWAPLLGDWRFEADVVEFIGAEPRWIAGDQQIGIGLAVGDITGFAGGSIETTIRFAAPFPGAGWGGGIIPRFVSLQDEFYYFQFGDRQAYAVSKYQPNEGFRQIFSAGSNANLRADEDYRIILSLNGQRIQATVNGVRVLEGLLPREPSGGQVGLITGIPISARQNQEARITFRDTTIEMRRPFAFVATQYGDPYDRIWTHVIRDAAIAEGFEPIRIDEVAGPNPILQDIKEHIASAAVIIGEITSGNANVFYEIGYGDAHGKPLVLLAQEGMKLPFDVSGYRTVFYQDVIGGESELDDNLRRQLRAIRRARPS